MLNNENLNSNNSINAKHTRLLSDYKSLRDKHNLLKNALILERERTKELELLISDSDMQKRKALQELESLVFRNDLLTKQINSLRDELDKERTRKSKKMPSTKVKDLSPTKEEVEVIKEELIKKITECSGLHSQISNLQFDHQMETNNFRSAINDLENQLRMIKEQSNLVESNIRKTLAQEMDERSAMEMKLENKDSLLIKLENSEQNLKAEVKELRHQLLSRAISSPTGVNAHEFKYDGSDLDSEKSKDIVDMKKSESLNNSLMSIPNDAHLTSSEINMCSLVDKIGQLEQKINSLELSNQITEKRMKIDKLYRDAYGEFITGKGYELPVPCQKKDSTPANEEPFQSDNILATMSKFYEDKILSLNKQIYQAIAKAAIYYDEVKTLDCRLECEKNEHEHYRSEMENLKQQIRTSQEDLDITRTQYDNKMRTMSIHIAELSSQLDSEKTWTHQHQSGDHLIKSTGTENMSSIKNFINALKK